MLLPHVAVLPRPAPRPVEIVEPPPGVPAAAAPAPGAAAEPPRAAGKPPRAAGARWSNVTLLMTLCALDGTLVMVAAAGGLSTLSGAVAVGLTTIAGAGAWLAARDAWAQNAAGRAGRRRAWAALCGVGAAATAAAVAAALAAPHVAALRVVPSLAGVVVLLVALDVAGARLRVARVPAPVAVLAVGALLEVLAWIS